MPIYEVMAKGFDVTHDLDSPASAASFSVKYDNVSQSRVFDPTIFNNLKIYRGEANPDKVRVKVTVNDVESELILGIADRSGWTDRDGGVAEGTLDGRDLMALALDKHPSAAFTIAAGTSFKAAVKTLADKAGLASSIFWSDDYAIATAIPVGVDTTLGSVLQTILAPLRWSDKSRVDAFVDGSTLIVAKRDYVSPPRGSVTVHASRLVTNRMEKAASLKVDDARVEGVKTKSIVVIEGLGGGLGGVVSDHQVVSTPTDYWTIDTEEEYDSQGRLIRKDRWTVYYLVSNVSKVRSEHEHAEYTFYDGSAYDGMPFQKAPKQGTWYLDVTDNWSGVGGTYRTREKTSYFAYRADDGTTKSQDESEADLGETAGAHPNQWVGKHVVTSIRWYRMGSHTLQETQVTTYNTQTGGVVSNQNTTQISPYKVGASSDSIATGNQVVNEVQAFAGPDPKTFSGLLRRESSELLGSAGCVLIRSYLLDDNGFVKVSASFRTPYDSGLQVGKLLTVTGAPSWWPVTVFLITSARLTMGEGLDCDLECVAWVT